jgi:hypothetical protein
MAGFAGRSPLSSIEDIVMGYQTHSKTALQTT